MKSSIFDVIKWVKALLVDMTILDAAQQSKLTRIVSLKTGSPIDQATNDEPRAFGLGVIQAYNPNVGRYWFYEGETLGFRALYMYSPCNGLIISAIFNSATNGENDNAGTLIMNVYKEILDDFPEYQCPPA